MIVGESLTGVTVTAKLIGTYVVPSYTVNVITARPFCSRAGVNVTVRSAPVGLITIFASGMTVVAFEVPVTVKDPTGLSISFTVNVKSRRWGIFVGSLIANRSNRWRIAHRSNCHCKGRHIRGCVVIIHYNIR